MQLFSVPSRPPQFFASPFNPPKGTSNNDNNTKSVTKNALKRRRPDSTHDANKSKTTLQHPRPPKKHATTEIVTVGVACAQSHASVPVAVAIPASPIFFAPCASMSRHTQQIGSLQLQPQRRRKPNRDSDTKPKPESTKENENFGGDSIDYKPHLSTSVDNTCNNVNNYDLGLDHSLASGLNVRMKYESSSFTEGVCKGNTQKILPLDRAWSGSEEQEYQLSVEYLSRPPTLEMQAHHVKDSEADVLWFHSLSTLK